MTLMLSLYRKMLFFQEIRTEVHMFIYRSIGVNRKRCVCVQRDEAIWQNDTTQWV